jgi:hypothetical protein
MALEQVDERQGDITSELARLALPGSFHGVSPAARLSGALFQFLQPLAIPGFFVQLVLGYADKIVHVVRHR